MINYHAELYAFSQEAELIVQRAHRQLDSCIVEIQRQQYEPEFRRQFARQVWGNYEDLGLPPLTKTIVRLGTDKAGVPMVIRPTFAPGELMWVNAKEEQARRAAAAMERSRGTFSFDPSKAFQ